LLPEFFNNIRQFQTFPASLSNGEVRPPFPDIRLEIEIKAFATPKFPKWTLCDLQRPPILRISLP
jgi:hypothetical protein